MLKSLELKNSILCLKKDIEAGIQNNINMDNKALELEKLIDEYKNALTSEQKTKLNFKNKETHPIMKDRIALNRVLKNLLSGRSVEEADQTFIPKMVDVASGNYNGTSKGAGAYLVSEEFLPIEKQNADQTDLSAFCRTIPVSKPSGKIPVIDMAQDLELIDFVSDNGTEIEKKSAAFTQLPYALSPKGAIIPVSVDLLEDADEDVVALIYELFNVAYTRGRNKEIVKAMGTTENTATGAFDQVAVIDAIKTAFTDTLNITYGKNAKVFMPQTVWAKVISLKDKAGQYYVQPVVTEPGKYAIDGHEVVVFENALGDDAVYVGDPMQIMVIERKGLEVSSDLSSGFKTYTMNTRAVARFQVVCANKKAFVKITNA